MLQMWTMKLAASINICSISDRLVCTVKVNIKERFIGNDGFRQMFIWSINCSQSIKDQLLDKFSN